MTEQEIIDMAERAGVTVRGHYDESGITPQEILRFANLVAEREREACIVSFEKEADSWVAWPQAGAAKRKGAAAIRTRGNGAVPVQAAAIPDELTCEDIERLRLALSWEGYSTPESLEACAARWPSLVRDLIAGVLDRKKRTQEAVKKGGAE